MDDVKQNAPLTEVKQDGAGEVQAPVKKKIGRPKRKPGEPWNVGQRGGTRVSQVALTEEKLNTVARRAVKDVLRINDGNQIYVDLPSDEKHKEIARIMKQQLKWFGRDIVKNDEEVATRLNEYFATVAETGEIPSFECLCLVLGIVKNTYYQWENGGQGMARAMMLRQARVMLANLESSLMKEGKIPVVGYIFTAKNFYDMKDSVEQVVTPNLETNRMSNDELRKKYLSDADGMIDASADVT